MAPVERLKRVLLSLPDLALRTSWLRDLLLNGSTHENATVLNALCEDNERADPEAREAILAVALFFASLGENELVERLRAQADTRHLLSLARLLRRAPPPAVHDRPARELPVPDYGTGRELTVGERKSLARSPNRRAFDKLLADPHPLVIRQLLENPRLTEDDVVRMTARRPARLEVLEAIAQHGRWLSRPRVRLSVLFNPGSPPALTMPLLAVCTRSELSEVLHHSESSPTLRTAAHELLERLPPLKETEPTEPTLQ
ncbi:MAG TPA: hypothetical protein VER96_21340 [Polyangiaceae bacterium]|nr:hypothetical protein [Polyangiaceae bacterium]